MIPWGGLTMSGAQLTAMAPRSTAAMPMPAFRIATRRYAASLFTVTTGRAFAIAFTTVARSRGDTPHCCSLALLNAAILDAV